MMRKLLLLSMLLGAVTLPLKAANTKLSLTLEGAVSITLNPGTQVGSGSYYIVIDDVFSTANALRSSNTTSTTGLNLDYSTTNDYTPSALVTVTSGYAGEFTGKELLLQITDSSAQVSGQGVTLTWNAGTTISATAVFGEVPTYNGVEHSYDVFLHGTSAGAPYSGTSTALLTITAVPEPSLISLLLASGILLAFPVVWRKKFVRQ